MPFVLLDLIFPPRCAHCHSHLGHGQALCSYCRRRVVLHRTFFCGKCRTRRYSAKGLCHRGFPFTLAAAGQYDDPVLKALIRSLKFHAVRGAAGPLGGLLTDYARRLGLATSYDLILPMPLSRRRQRERGFNQAELIATELSARTGLPVDSSSLSRTRHSPPQSGIRGDAERRMNIAGSFEVRTPGAVPILNQVRGRNIILLDDVVTSGATMLEASLAHRAAGAKDILALAVAKA